MRTTKEKTEVASQVQSAEFTSSVSNAIKGISSFHRKIDASTWPANQLDMALAGMVSKPSPFLTSLKEIAQPNK